MNIRCPWAEASPEEQEYHDTEWGIPVYDDGKLFEMLSLEGAQAGLSWRTILNKREGYRAAFCGFDYEKVAKFTDRDVECLLLGAGIVRNRLKVKSVIGNARGVIEIRKVYGSLSDFLWAFVEYQPIQNVWKTMEEVPNETEISRKMSKELKKYGFRFVGPTICYAFMQASGMVNDHLVDCLRYEEIKRLSKV